MMETAGRGAAGRGILSGLMVGALIVLVLAWNVFSWAAEESVAYTNVQWLYGGGFDDRLNGNETADRSMNTVTFEHGGAWRYGDHFFFLDVTHGGFVDPAGVMTGMSHRLYGEWFPRLSLFRLIAGQGLSWGPIKDLYLAGGLNMGGDGFYAELAGISVDFDVPDGAVLGVSVFLRDDTLNAPTYQISPVWSVPFNIGAVALSFDGFAHISGLDSGGPDLITEPQLLVDLAALLPHLPKGQLRFGIEWYYHRNAHHATQALQTLFKWVW